MSWELVTDEIAGQPRRPGPAEMSVLPDGPLLTITEVAAATRVSKMTIYRLIQDGSLSALRIGRSLRVPLSALEAFLTANRLDSGGPTEHP